MKLLVLFSCLWGLVLSSDVVELGDSDFADKIKTYGTTLVEFYAPWCGHCKKLVPEYEIAATQLLKADPVVTLVKVDCPANTETCQKFGVSGYPTLKIFREGEFSADYQGPRTADGIVSYMKKQVEPASRPLESVKAFEDFISSKDVPVVVGFFSNPEGTDAKAFAKLTMKLRDDYSFGHSYDPDVNEKATYADSVVVFRPKHLANKFEANSLAMKGEIKESTVTDFLADVYFGLCGHMTTQNAEKFKKPLLTAYYDVDYKMNPKGTNYWRNRVMKVGKKYNEKLTFSIASSNDFARVLEDAGVKVGEAPAVMIKDASDKKYVMEEVFTPKGETLDAFIQSYLAGELTPKIKSEPVPDNTDAPVKTIVGANFDEIVMDNTKDVLIEFYAPWCGHCKSLAPKWEELGEKLKGEEDLVIAKIDATANDSPAQFEVSGFPTIYWAPKNNKEKPLKYNGGREVDDFVAYLKQHASSKLQKTEL